MSLDDLLRIDEDVVDDVAFEEKDKDATAEAQAQEAAVRANEAAVRAAQAAVAAAQARATAEQAHQAPPAQPQPQPQPVQQPYYGAAPMPQQPAQPAQPQAPYAPQAPEPYDAQSRRPRGPWSTFPYPVLCVLVFLGGGFLFGWWHPGWFVFLTIPLYYWIAHIIENDPNYRANRR